MPQSVPHYLNNIRIILSRTSHPANIGSAARAMKTMGLSKLVIVAPNLIATPMTPNPPVYQENNADFRLPEESFILASGAADVLERAKIVPTLEQALEGTTISCALTSRRRELSSEPIAGHDAGCDSRLTSAQIEGVGGAVIHGHTGGDVDVDTDGTTQPDRSAS